MGHVGVVGESGPSEGRLKPGKTFLGCCGLNACCHMDGFAMLICNAEIYGLEAKVNCSRKQITP